MPRPSNTSLAFPVFDLGVFERSTGEARQELGREVDAICRNTGFLAIRNHGVPQGVIDTVWREARDFFDLPPEEKLKARAPHKGYPYGYLGPDAEALARSKGVDTPADLKESFNGGPLGVPDGMTDAEALAFCYAPTIWPEGRPGFAAAWKAYYGEMEKLAGRVMRLFAVALELPEDFFESYIDAPVSALRALNYPEQPVEALPGQLRAGAHTDYGSLTILLPQPASKGLELMTPDGKWTPVPAQDRTFVIDIGDLMALWTNDRWVSTLHRVVNPPPSERLSARRQSLAFFHQPNWFAEIAPLPSAVPPGARPKYAPVLSGPYLMGKFKATTVPKVA